MGSGSSNPFNKEPVEVDPIRVIDFEDFKEMGSYPQTIKNLLMMCRL